jgi:hypothetical protein
MKRTTTIKTPLFLFFITVSPLFVSAYTGQPASRIDVRQSLQLQLVQDTIPPVKAKETTAKTSTTEAIRVIPTARRQPIPVPVNVKVKPVKVAVPKIIRPVVRLIP